MNIDDGSPRAPLRVGIRERLLAVRAIGPFRGIDDEAATLLTEHARILSFEAGSYVSDGGDVDTVHVILDGTVRVIYEGRQIDLMPGRPLGLIGALSARGQGPRAVAVTATRTLAIPVDAFLMALEDNFSLWRSTFRLNAETLLDIRGDLPASEPPGVQAPDDPRPRLLVERALAIANTRIFTDANIDAVFDVARIMHEVRVPAGHSFWRASDPSGLAVRIVSGSVRCTLATGESTVVSADYMLGMLSAAASRPQPFSAVAETYVRAYELQFEEWLVVLEAHPELAMRLLTMITTELAQHVVGAQPRKGLVTGAH